MEVDNTAAAERVDAMKIKPRDYRVPHGKPVNLGDWPTLMDPVYESKEDYRRLLEKHVKQLSALQRVYYAANRYSILVIFQGMDAAGKDGVIRHVMSGVNPQGCQVFSFVHPTPAELEHDFLWRATRFLPARRHIGIFNRSYYEEVLIARVHPLILRTEGLPDEMPLAEDDVWAGRYRSIVDFEEHLHRNGTRIIKVLLHLSKDEQRRRFLERIDDPNKNWKFSFADVEERKFWEDYMRAYEACIGATSTEHAPWYIVPADDKQSSRLIVSEIVHDVLSGLHLQYPKATAKHRRELESIRNRLAK